MAEFRSIRPSVLAVRFFGVAVVALMVAGGIAALLARWFGSVAPFGRAQLPGAFWFSTLFLAGGSLALHLAVGYVRREKQRPFRICMWAGVFSGTLFVGVQLYGLWMLVRYFRQGAPGSDELVVGEVAAVFAGLHAIHFLVALLFVIYTTMHALSHRYDHEYYLGISLVLARSGNCLGGNSGPADLDHHVCEWAGEVEAQLFEIYVAELVRVRTIRNRPKSYDFSYVQAARGTGHSFLLPLASAGQKL